MSGEEGSVVLDASQVAVIRKALIIGFACFDGDPWFAKDLIETTDSISYTEAGEAMFDAAFRLILGKP